MIDENWLDGSCYSIQFKNLDGHIFLRNVTVPYDFLEDDVKKIFYTHFKQGTLKIISIDYISDVWISKKYYQMTTNWLTSGKRDKCCQKLNL